MLDHYGGLVECKQTIMPSGSAEYKQTAELCLQSLTWGHLGTFKIIPYIA